MESLKYIFPLIFILSISFTSASYGYCNPNLPGGQACVPVAKSTGTNYYNNTYYNVTGGAGNISWNQSYANNLYIGQGNTSVNGLFNNNSYLTTYNSTYDNMLTNVSINYTLFTVNSYNNAWLTTYNQSYDLKVNYTYGTCAAGQAVMNTTSSGVECTPVSTSEDNISWNQSYANSLYLTNTSKIVLSSTYNVTVGTSIYAQAKIFNGGYSYSFPAQTNTLMVGYSTGAIGQVAVWTSAGINFTSMFYLVPISQPTCGLGSTNGTLIRNVTGCLNWCNGSAWTKIAC